MSDQPCPTCGGTTGFVKRRGTLDVCDDPWHDEQQPKRMGENGCDCDVVLRSTYVNVCQQRDELQSYKDRLPADWFKDSSLKTWFPITNMMLEDVTVQRDELLAALKDAREALQYYADKNPVSESNITAAMTARDAIEDINAAIAKASGSEGCGHG